MTNEYQSKLFQIGINQFLEKINEYINQLETDPFILHENDEYKEELKQITLFVYNAHSSALMEFFSYFSNVISQNQLNICHQNNYVAISNT